MNSNIGGSFGATMVLSSSICECDKLKDLTG